MTRLKSSKYIILFLCVAYASGCDSTDACPLANLERSEKGSSLLLALYEISGVEENVSAFSFWLL